MGSSGVHPMAEDGVPNRGNPALEHLRTSAGGPIPVEPVESDLPSEGVWNGDTESGGRAGHEMGDTARESR